MFPGEITPGIAKGLKEPRQRIQAAQIPSSKLDETLNLASWNIREFGKKPRRPESLHFIAEIIGQFDLVCIVELRDNLDDFNTVLKYLGPTWRAVVSDYDFDPGGNRERLAFVYDERAARFTGLAAEAGPPRKKNADGEYISRITFRRRRQRRTTHQGTLAPRRLGRSARPRKTRLGQRHHRHGRFQYPLP